MKPGILLLCCLVSFVLAPAAIGAETIRYNGSSTILKGVLYDASKAYTAETGVEFDLKGKSTGYGLQKILAGECDIAGGGRPLKKEETEKGLVQTRLFIDGYAFIVNKTNPADKITGKQIQGVLSGEITSWDDLGGPAGKNIVVLSPPLKSAHYKNAQKIIGFTELPKNSIIVDMTPNVYKKVKSFPVSLGWLSYANVNKAADVKVLEISIGGKEVPLTQDSISSGAYPYQQSMYFYTVGQPSGEIKKFIDYMKSEKGAAHIVGAGFFLAK